MMFVLAYRVEWLHIVKRMKIHSILHFHEHVSSLQLHQFVVNLISGTFCTLLFVYEKEKERNSYYTNRITNGIQISIKCLTNRFYS